MNEHVSNDPLERLMARFDEAGDGGVPEVVTAQSGDPLERLGAWIGAARDLSVVMDGAQVGGVLDELLKRIESARVIASADDGDFLAADGDDPRARIADWIRDECAELGSVPAIVSLRAAGEAFVVSPQRQDRGEQSVEAALGRAVLSMIGDVPLEAKSRKKAVELLAVAIEQPSPQALQAVLRVLIGGE